MHPLFSARLRLWLFGLSVLSSGCATLPEVQLLEFQDSNETYTSKAQQGTPAIWDAVLARCRDGKARVALLEHGEESLIARINLIRSARKSIRIQTFIWAYDETGRWLMWELIRAVKQRGVRVELLIDQMFSEQEPSFLAFLSTVDPKFKVKLYNPNENKIRPSTLGTLIDLASDFRKVNVRMHNKVMIVDDQIVITGGRNLSNRYFDQAQGLNYKDRDILVAHSDCEPIIRSFGEYWDADWAVPAHQLEDVALALEENKYPRLSRKGEFDLRGLFKKADKLSSDSSYLNDIALSSLMSVNEIEWVFDDPKKTGAILPGTGQDIATKLANLVLGARRSIWIQSPYVVLSDRARRLFLDLKKARPSVKVVVSTNSLAATDSWFTYAANYKEKRVYLQDLGFEMREFKPIPEDIQEMMAYDALLTRRPVPSDFENPMSAQFSVPRDLPPFSFKTSRGEVIRSSRLNDHLQSPPFLCLHGKSLVVDEELSYVGSYNLDPRSGTYNTEVGVIIRDSAFAKKLKEVIERDISPGNSYLISAKKGLPILRTINLLFYRISEELPLLDPWPFRYASSFELRPGKPPVAPSHPDFHKNWKDLGNFPLLSYMHRKHMAARLFKATGMIFKPLL